jgi:hypothetical protein
MCLFKRSKKLRIVEAHNRMMFLKAVLSCAKDELVTYKDKPVEELIEEVDELYTYIIKRLETWGADLYD